MQRMTLRGGLCSIPTVMFRTISKDRITGIKEKL